MISYNRLSIGSHEALRCNGSYDTYDCKSFLGISSIMRNYIWSPIVWLNGKRGKNNFLSSHYCALDFENPEVSLKDMQNVFSDVPHIIGTTRNHQKYKGDILPCDRFRVLLPWERPITNLNEYEFNLLRVIKRYGADENCSDGARIFLQCEEIIYLDPSGPESMEVIPQLVSAVKISKEALKQYTDKQERLNSIGRMSSFAVKWLSNVIPEGQRNNICFALGCDLARAGLSYDDAVSRVLSSPTYKCMVLEAHLLSEIRRCIANGFNETKKQD